MKRFRHLTYIGMLFFVAPYATAQSWNFIATGSNGLPTERITNIRSSGSLDWPVYAMHANSISRFNGKWQHFPGNFGAQSERNTNWTFYFDQNGGLWLGRTDGIYYVSPQQLASDSPVAENKTAELFPPGNTPAAFAIFIDRNQKLWIGSNLNLICASLLDTAGTTGTYDYIAKQCAAIKSVRGIVQDSHPNSKSIWVRTSRDIYRFSETGDSLGHYLSNIRMNGLFADSKGRVWVATRRDGLQVLADPSKANATFEQVPTPISCDQLTVNARSIADVVEDFSGSIWAAAPDRVYRYQNTKDPDPQNWIPEIFPCGDDWPQDVTNINRLAVDMSGFIWVNSASLNEGILRYNTIWETIRFSNRDDIPLYSDNIHSLYRSEKDGSMYIGADGRAVWQKNDGSWQDMGFDAIAALCSDSADVHAFYEDTTAGNLFMAVTCNQLASKLAFFDGTTTKEIPLGNAAGDFVNSGFKAIVRLPDSTIWFAGSDHLWAARITNPSAPLTFIRLDDSLGLARQQHHALLVEEDRFIWIGTSKAGLLRYNIEERLVDRRLKTVGAFQGSTVLSLAFDTDGGLLVGTMRGLVRLTFQNNSPQWQDIFFSNDKVNFVFTDMDGNVWFDAPDGVARFNEKIGLSFFRSRTSISEVGPADRVVNAGLSVISQTGREALWFGANSGLSIFNGDLIPPQTRITRPLATDPGVAEIAPGIFRLSKNAVFVQFEGQDNLTPGDLMQFRTELRSDSSNGLLIESQSNNFSTNHSQELLFPESGIYHYRVWARDQLGNIDPEPAQVVFNVDIDAPSTAIIAPAPNTQDSVLWVSSELVVKGSVLDRDLDHYEVEIYNLQNRLSQRVTKTDTVRGDALAFFSLPAGTWHEADAMIRLFAIDKLQHIRRDSVKVRIDAMPPDLKIINLRGVQQVSSSVQAEFELRNESIIKETLFYLEKTSANKNPLEKPVRLDTTAMGQSGGIFTFTGTVDITAAIDRLDTLIFIYRDPAKHEGRDTLVVQRKGLAEVSRSTVQTSADGLVEVHLPAGADSIALRISPVDTIGLSFDAARQKLHPISLLYRIDPDSLWRRRATLSFKVLQAFPESSKLTITRRGNTVLQPIATQPAWEGESPREYLRTIIDRGGAYFLAIGTASDNTISGNVTCRPRFFSPGKTTLSPFTDIDFALKNDSPVSISIYNPAGRQVRKLHENMQYAPGQHSVRWDGRDNNGQILRSGIYILVVQTNAFTETKTVVIQN